MTRRPTPDRDQRATLRLLVALNRLRHGQENADVAATTHVPLRLVELLAKEMADRNDKRRPGEAARRRN